MPWIGIVAGLGIALSTGPLIGAGIVTSVAIANAMIWGGLMTALNSFLSVITPKPKLPKQSLSQTLTMLQPAAPRQTIYGTDRVGGIIVFLDKRGSSGEFLDVVIAVAGHEVNAISQIYFGTDLVTFSGSGIGAVTTATGKYAGKCRMQMNLGTTTQSALSGLVAANPKWTVNHKGLGIAHVWLELKFDTTLYPNGMPSVTFQVQGKKVFDPRSSTIAFSANAALCWRDYMTTPKISGGVGAPTSRVNDTVLMAAANTCDEAVSVVGGGTIPRYSCNGSFTLDENRVDVLKAIQGAMGAYAPYIAGKWQLYPAAWRSPVLSLSTADFRGPIQYQANMRRDQRFNAASGSFKDPLNNYQANSYPPYFEGASRGFVSDQWLTFDGGERIYQTIDFSFVQDHRQCQRLAKISLERARREGTLTAPCKLSAYQAAPPAVVQITHATYAWVNKTFEIAQMAFNVDDKGSAAPVLGVDCIFRETDASVYAWSTAEEIAMGTPGANPVLPDNSVVGSATGLTLSTQYMVRGDGSMVPAIEVQWIAPADAFVTSGGRMQIQFQKVGDPGWGSGPNVDGASTVAYITTVTEGVSYNVQVRAVNKAGGLGAWVAAGPFTVLPVTAMGSAMSLLDNGSFEFNAVGAGATLDPTYGVLAGKLLCDGWIVQQNDTPWFTVFRSTAARTGNYSALIQFLSGFTFPYPGDATARIWSVKKVPVSVGIPARVSGYKIWQWDGAGIPSGLLFGVSLGLFFFDSGDNFLGFVGQIITNTPTGFSWQLMQSAIVVPATLGGGVPAYARVGMQLEVSNTGGVAVAIPAGRIIAQILFDDVVAKTQASAFDLTPISTSYTIVGANPLSAPVPSSSSTGIINIAAASVQFGDGLVAYSGGSITGLTAGGVYFVYSPDPTYSGGAVAYLATTDPSVANNANGNIFWGVITIPAVAGTPVTAGRTGGNGPVTTGRVGALNY